MTLATACCQRNFDDLACRVSRLTEALIRDEQVPVAIKSHRCRKAQPSHDRLPCNCPAIQSHHHAGIGDVRRRREESGKCLQRIDLAAVYRKAGDRSQASWNWPDAAATGYLPHSY